MTVRTAMVSVLRSSSRPTNAASSGGTSDGARRDVALVPDSVSSGAGNQVSSIDPSALRVANPMLAAPVTVVTVLGPSSRHRIASPSVRECDSVSARPTRVTHYAWGRAGLAGRSHRADRGAG